MTGKNTEKQGLGRIYRASASKAIAADAGAYALVIRLDRRFAAPVGALGPVALEAGCYLYLGSARGPGGMRARIARHLRPGKSVRWHVDRLTRAGRIIRILAVAGGDECDLAARAFALPGIGVPVPGFGSSDCRTCPAHLLRVPDDGDGALGDLSRAVD